MARTFLRHGFLAPRVGPRRHPRNYLAAHWEHSARDGNKVCLASLSSGQVGGQLTYHRRARRSFRVLSFVVFETFYVSFMSTFLVATSCIGGGYAPSSSSSSSPLGTSAARHPAPFGTLHAYGAVQCTSLAHLPQLAAGAIGAVVLFLGGLLLAACRRTEDPLAQGLFASQDSLYGLRLLVCEARRMRHSRDCASSGASLPEHTDRMTQPRSR